MDIKSLKQATFTSSQYIKPKRFTYKKGGKTHTWDFIEQKDSVSVLLFHTQKRAFIFVRQFRIPLYDYQLRNGVKLDENELGYSVELCSGLVDKPLSVTEIAREECVEELGFLPRNLELIAQFYSGFGSCASRQSVFFAAVDESDKIGHGGGVDVEEIEAVFVPVAEFEDFAKGVVHSANFEFAYLWFMDKKAEIYGL